MLPASAAALLPTLPLPPSCSRCCRRRPAAAAAPARSGSPPWPTRRPQKKLFITLLTCKPNQNICNAKRNVPLPAK